MRKKFLQKNNFFILFPKKPPIWVVFKRKKSYPHIFFDIINIYTECFLHSSRAGALRGRERERSNLEKKIIWQRKKSVNQRRSKRPQRSRQQRK